MKKNSSPLVTGLGIAGLAAAALVGGYFFYGKDGKKHRKNIKAWSIKAKGEVLEKLEKAKDLSEDVFHTTIDTIASKYAKSKDVSEDEINLFVKDLKKHLKDIKKEVAPVVKKTVKKVAALKK